MMIKHDKLVCELYRPIVRHPGRNSDLITSVWDQEFEFRRARLTFQFLLSRSVPETVQNNYAKEGRRSGM